MYDRYLSLFAHTLQPTNSRRTSTHTHRPLCVRTHTRGTRHAPVVGGATDTDYANTPALGDSGRRAAATPQ